jgi:hypothetical protein
MLGYKNYILLVKIKSFERGNFLKLIGFKNMEISVNIFFWCVHEFNNRNMQFLPENYV